MSETTDLAAAVQAAHDKVTDMCSGSGRWTMSIPVRLDHDHDVVITRALTMQAEALSAARRELETAQALCNRYASAILKSAGTNAVAFDPMNPEGWMHAQAQYVLGLISALEDVRRVEAWMEDYPDGRYVDVSRGWFCMVDVRRGDDEDVPAESIAALGRALAQEAGDDTP